MYNNYTEAGQQLHHWARTAFTNHTNATRTAFLSALIILDFASLCRFNFCNTFKLSVASLHTFFCRVPT